MKYKFDMNSAQDAGHNEHPMLTIRQFAPDATEFEPVSIADCWLLESEPIENAPDFFAVFE